MTNALAEQPRAGTRGRRGYLSVALVTVLPVAIVLVLGQHAPLVVVGAVWLLGALAVGFAPQFPIGQKIVAVAMLPVCAILWRIEHLVRGETLCFSPPARAVTVCPGGHPALSRVFVFVGAAVLIAIILVAALVLRWRRSRV